VTPNDAQPTGPVTKRSATDPVETAIEEERLVSCRLRCATDSALSADWETTRTWPVALIKAIAGVTHHIQVSTPVSRR